MRRYLFTMLLGMAALPAFSQATITLETVKQHVGDSVKVCGKVASTRFLESANGTPTLINIGAAFPNELLTVVVFGENRAKFKEKPEDAWKDKTICITGRIVEYRGKPQIVVTAPEQVKVE